MTHVRIPNAFYDHIPSQVRSNIRREFLALEDTRTWDIWHEEVQARYGVRREIITRILTTSETGLRAAFFRWVVRGR